MDKVFTRWPRDERLSSRDRARDPIPPSPLSDHNEPRISWRGPAGYAASAAVVIVLLTLAVALTSHLDSASTLLAMLAVASAAVAGASAYHAARARRTTAESDARYLAVFERAGISMWREDWSAAAEEVMSLRQRGVTDMEGHFATRPDELRALCAKVMIRDVNAFTVEEAGAPSKQAFIGPLDRLLPHTDQTFVQWLVAFAQGERFFRSEAHITMPDGSVRDTLFAAALPTDLDGFRNIIVTSLDITGYKSEQAKLHAADAEIARASRISTVGALSASIAHEVNSPLAAVIANAQAALRWLRRPDPNVADATEAVSAIVAEATRAKDVVVRTRAFVGNAPVDAAPFDVVTAGREAVLLVEGDLRRLGAAVHLQSEPHLPQARGDVIQVQQVFTNLLLNAAQAMAGQSRPKEITISFTSDDACVRVDVADTGPGIDPSHLERVFDPFYTSKSDGMGIGLAICRNCIDAQGGNIWASTSGADAGVAIHFTLPIQHD